MVELRDCEKYAKIIARKYSKDADSIADLEQIARITAWMILEKNPEASIGYLITSMNHAITGDLVYYNALKRMPAKGFVSIDKEVSSKDGEERTLKDIIPSRDIVNIEQEPIDALKDFLKKNYGRYFYNKLITNEKQPGRIANNLVRYVIEDIAQIPLVDIPKEADYLFFRKMGLSRFLQVFYENSAHLAINTAYPDMFSFKDFRHAGNGYWKGRHGLDRAIREVKKFAEEKGLKSRYDCSHISLEDFKDAGLSGMMQRVFNDSPYLALKTIFSDLKPWDTYVTKNFYENEKNQKTALLDYLLSSGIGNIEMMSDVEVFDSGLRDIALKESLSRFGLRGLLNRYNNSVYKLFATMFPDQIHPWTLKSSKDAWDGDKRKIAAEAVRWLFEKYLAIPLDEVPDYATYSLFCDVGFKGMLTNKLIGFNSSPFAAVDNAYPDRFSKKEFHQFQNKVYVG